MLVRDLKIALEDIRNIFDSAGAKAQARAMQDVLALVQNKEGQDLDSFLSELRLAISPVEKFSAALKAAGTDERMFNGAFEAMKSSNPSKDDVLAIAKSYTGSADASLSKDKLIKAISTHFYVLAYEHDSRAIARRATPW